MIPVKAFGLGKSRLEPILDASTRQQLSQALVERTLRLTGAISDKPTVVTGDDEVAEVAMALGADIHPDPGSGLSDAVSSAVGRRRDTWLVVHADLPLLDGDDIAVLANLASDGVIVPSPDGGTPIIGGTDLDFPFAYGVGSFHRHLRSMPDATVVTTLGPSLDLDSPADLTAALTHPRGAWLRDILAHNAVLVRDPL